MHDYWKYKNIDGKMEKNAPEKNPAKYQKREE